jgi:hypothetical protein
MKQGKRRKKMIQWSEYQVQTIKFLLTQGLLSSESNEFDTFCTLSVYADVVGHEVNALKAGEVLEPIQSRSKAQLEEFCKTIRDSLIYKAYVAGNAS